MISSISGIFGIKKDVVDSVELADPAGGCPDIRGKQDGRGQA